MRAPQAAPAARRVRLSIAVRGVVQGVGFRPFVYRQATALGLSGWAANSAAGLRLEAEGDPDDVGALLAALRESPPPHASVTDVEAVQVPLRGETGFAIRPSTIAGPRTADVLPDLATCAECLEELFDPADRRYLYAFINCTHCGPRYSIVESLPYDRARTSMRRFPMCPRCRAEYQDPADRRFHAEPNACPVCGPRLSLRDAEARQLGAGHDALLAAADGVRAGRIVAVKGIGGFHLVADARSDAAVRRLRARKRRAEKPFAVMFPTLADLEQSCRASPPERALLTGPERPIVLLARAGGPVADAVAPGNPRLGAMLPYSPLHHLLMRALGFPVVATSGNVSDEPIVTHEAEAFDRLGRMADLFLMHDRPIVRPIDDSIARVVCGRELVLRRARGYAPARIALPGAPEGIVAVGGHLKATLALTRSDGAVVSQHLGDLATSEARAVHARTLADLTGLHGAEPRLIACDQHPDYATTRTAEAAALPVIRVQHHVAHVAACVAEHALGLPVLGVAWDGSGHGPDGTVWGGEFLVLAETGWRRVAHLRPFRLPGGEAAVREPRRAALGLLFDAFGARAFEMSELAPVAAFTRAERKVLCAMLANRVNTPLTSSAGRLFDAFAALTGLRQRASYEGQAAAELEWAAGARASGRGYTLRVRDRGRDSEPLIVDWQPALEAALADLARGAGAGAVSEALHNGLAGAIAAVAARVGEPRVVLTGGCFQNARLTEAAVAAVQRAGLEPCWHRRVPPNDGGIALGQAAWAARARARGERPCA